MHLPDPVVLATPFFIAFVIAEMVFGRLTARARFEAKDTAASLLMGFGSTVIGAAIGFVFVAFFASLWPLRMATIGWSLAAIAACFVADDFIYYWWHRASHRVRWFWADHVQHHSSQHFNLSTALRQPWTGVLTLGLVFRVPLVLIGFPLPMIAFVHGVNLVYQFWIHSEAIGRLPGPFEAAMNTPSHHRVHHATNPRYLDSNYAGVFIVWDRMFGTFVKEEAGDPPRFGIVKNLATFNPLRIAAHEWIGMVSDLVRARSAREFALYLLGPPGWSPDGSRDTTDSIKARWAAFRSAQSISAAPAE
jgi:sterol desaturase/sphingolipid hydroxylase (fatty acid hydroxylase superfamily)